jgi:hypothetical protein
LKGTQERLVSVVPTDKNEPPRLRANKPYESGTEEKATLKGTTGKARLRGSDR